MKVLSSIVAMAAAQWDGFNDYQDLEKNQASPVSVYDVLAGQNAGNAVAGALSADFTTAPTNVMGNGRKCWFCNARSVKDCFGSNTFSICQGQEYFCFYHERRKISHFFNRREKYIDHVRSTNGDAFLGRNLNEAFNHPSTVVVSDRDAPSTQIHVMAGCQQPQACLRQQAQNNAINIGVPFYGAARHHRLGSCRPAETPVRSAPGRTDLLFGHRWTYDNQPTTSPVSVAPAAHSRLTDTSSMTSNRTTVRFFKIRSESIRSEDHLIGSDKIIEKIRS